MPPHIARRLAPVGAGFFAVLLGTWFGSIAIVGSPDAGTGDDDRRSLSPADASLPSRDARRRSMLDDDRADASRPAQREAAAAGRESFFAARPRRRAATGPRAARRAGAGEAVEVCGGWLDVADASAGPGADAVRTLLAARRQALEARLLPALRASRAETSRAAADFYVAESGRAAVDATLADAARERLAARALQSVEPLLQAWATAACRAVAAPRSPACALVQPEQWARLDPDDASAWLAVAAAAAERGDAVARDEARSRAARAPRRSDGYATLAATLLDHVPAGDADAIGALAVVDRVAAFEAPAAGSPVATTATERGDDLGCAAIERRLLQVRDRAERSASAR